jgi:hypothetical protein
VQALTIRTLTGRVIGPAGSNVITSGKVVATPYGVVPSDVTGGVLVPLSYTYPIASGVLTCTGSCLIVSPANYTWQVYETSGNQSMLRWSFNAGVPESAAAITLQEIYLGSSGALTWAAGGSGCSPGGTGSELQYRSGASTFGAVTGSSVSGGAITLGTPLGLASGGLNTDLTCAGGCGPAIGSMLIPATSSTMKWLAGNTTAVKQYLSNTGNGAISADPAWATIAVADVTGAAPLASPTFTGTITLPDGSQSVPSIVNSSGMGFYSGPSGGWTFANKFGGNPLYFFYASYLSIEGDVDIRWTAAGALDAKDTGIGRASAGVLKVTNGSTGLGQLQLSIPAYANNAAAVAALGANRLYYTDTAGEYIVKITH